MQLLNDIHHLTFITADMDRLIGFYERVFDASRLISRRSACATPSSKSAHTVLHPFQVPAVEPPGPEPMFKRGRLDHFALQAASEPAFREVRRRLVAERASDGAVTDMGSLLFLNFIDPDEGAHEVVWVKPGVPVGQGLRHSEWTKVQL